MRLAMTTPEHSILLAPNNSHALNNYLLWPTMPLLHSLTAQLHLTCHQLKETSFWNF